MERYAEGCGQPRVCTVLAFVTQLVSAATTTQIVLVLGSVLRRRSPMLFKDADVAIAVSPPHPGTQSGDSVLNKPTAG